MGNNGINNEIIFLHAVVVSIVGLKSMIRDNKKEIAS